MEKIVKIKEHSLSLPKISEVMQEHTTKNGLTAGILLVALSVAYYFTDNYIILIATRLLEYIIMIIFMVKSVKGSRASLGGTITLKDAFKPAWLTFILAGSIEAICTFILYNYIDTGMKIHIQEMQMQGFNKIATSFNISDQDKQNYLDNIKNNDAFGIRSITIDLPFSFIFPGALISLILALIMKKESTSKI